jgi:hypothetical protein
MQLFHFEATTMESPELFFGNTGEGASSEGGGLFLAIMLPLPGDGEEI